MLIAYLIVRNDLPSMNPGKMAAQAFHAGNQIAQYCGVSGERPTGQRAELARSYLREGTQQGADGFNTTIGLEANGEQMKALLGKLDAYPYPYNAVIDPSYPFWMDEELIPFVSGVTITETRNPDTGMVLATRREMTGVWLIGDRDDVSFRCLVADFKRAR